MTKKATAISRDRVKVSQILPIMQEHYVNSHREECIGCDGL